MYFSLGVLASWREYNRDDLPELPRLDKSKIGFNWVNKDAKAQRRNYNYCFFTLKAPGTEEGDKVRTLEGVRLVSSFQYAMCADGSKYNPVFKKFKGEAIFHGN